MGDTVLIVDDNSAVRDSLDMLLADEGYQLHFADNGEDCLELAEEVRPDIILLDIMMPAMDGYEVCERIRQTSSLREIPVILLTALDDKESRLRGISSGADDFISKPFDRNELRERIRTITRLNRYKLLPNERRRFEWIMRVSQEAYLVVDERDIIRFANTRAQRAMGVSTQSVESGTVKFLPTVSQSYRPEPNRAWNAWPYEPNDKDRKRYLIRRHGTGTPTWFEVVTLQQDDTTSPLFLIHLKNVTRQVHDWRELRLIHSVLSHKLRTPLNNAIGSLKLLGESRPSSMTDEENAEYSNLAKESAEQLEASINDLLLFADAASLLAKGSPFMVGALPEMLEELREEIGNITIMAVVEESVAGETLNLTHAGMQAIMRELLSNSHRFSPDSNAIVRIFADHARGDTSLANSIAISVIDDGVRMTDDELQSAQQPFYQGRAMAYNDVRGVGLGLAVVSSILWEVGGSVSIRNLETSKGVLVELAIPIASRQNQ